MTIFFANVGTMSNSSVYDIVKPHSNRIAFEGIINNYKTDSGQKVGMFLLDEDDVYSNILFRSLFPFTSAKVPDTLPEEVYDYYNELK